MIKRLIIYLIRRKLDLKKNEVFQFENQRYKKEVYWFTDYLLIKKGQLGKNPFIECTAELVAV